MKFSLLVAEMQNGTTSWENSLTHAYNVKHTPTRGPGISANKCSARRNGNRDPSRDVYTCVCSSFIHKLTLDITQISINRDTDRQIVIDCNGILFGNQDEQTTEA